MCGRFANRPYGLWTRDFGQRAGIGRDDNLPGAAPELAEHQVEARQVLPAGAEEGAGREVDALAVPQVEQGQHPQQVAHLPTRGLYSVAPQQPPEIYPPPGETAADDGEF